MHENPERFAERLVRSRDRWSSEPDLNTWYDEARQVPGRRSEGVARTGSQPVTKGYTPLRGATRDVTMRRLGSGATLVVPVDLDRRGQSLTESEVAEALRNRSLRLRKAVRGTQLVDFGNPADLLWEQRYNMPGFRSWAGGGHQLVLYRNWHKALMRNEWVWTYA